MQKVHRSAAYFNISNDRASSYYNDNVIGRMIWPYYSVLSNRTVVAQ